VFRNLKEAECEDVEWNHLAQYVYNGGFNDQYLLQKGSALWS